MSKKSSMTVAKELKPSELRWYCDSKQLEFKTTADLSPLDSIIGQPRALEALEMGAGIPSAGYNLFVSGLSGTGRLTTVKRMLEKLRADKANLFDFCYVHNFSQPAEPRLLRFAAGMGDAFARTLEETITIVLNRIKQEFSDDAFRRSRRSVENKFLDQDRDIASAFANKIAPHGFVIGQSTNENGSVTQELLLQLGKELYGIDSVEPMVVAGQLQREAADELLRLHKQFYEEFIDLVNQRMRIAQEMHRKVLEHDQLAAGTIVQPLFDELRGQFRSECPAACKFLDEAQDYLMAKIQFLVAASYQNEQTSGEERELVRQFLRKLEVNTLHANSDNVKPPVVVETNPTYSNLFGVVERKQSSSGLQTSDHLNIKSGSLLEADGGYLIVNALDILTEPGVWKPLKRLLLYRRLDIQAQGLDVQMKPQFIDLNVKLIMIGDEDLYRILWFEEEDFRKIFKLNAQFDYETPFSAEMLHNLARFVCKICTEEHLPHFTTTGVAALAEVSCEIAGRHDWQSLRFSALADMIREASFYATKDGKKQVVRAHVEKAMNLRKWRNNLLDEKIHNHIVSGDHLIDTQGLRVGQINGLSVFSTGLVSFGKPARITATAGAGSSGLVNIEREVELSGSMHDKGVLIILGLLRSWFAQHSTITLSASIAFEQSYDEIDGDSASSTEVYCLLSALSGIPLRQDIAVTGSVNQLGDIQPIGGVNEKITGFFQLCKERGLTGSQGVLIPKMNTNSLMLPDEIVDAVRKKLFHIWTITRIEQGIELLLGTPAGTMDEDDNWTEGSVFEAVQERLDDFRELVKEQEGGGDSMDHDPKPGGSNSDDQIEPPDFSHNNTSAL